MKVFPPFRPDTVNQCVWRLGDTAREERILLTPKAFAVLAYHAAAMAEAQKNANDYYILWFLVHQAWLHLHALDFRSVLAICQSALALLRDPALRTAPGQPIAVSH
jgi:hypothetical protein